MKWYMCLCFIVTLNSAYSQDYIGAGNDDGIQVTASDQYKDDFWADSARAQYTISGEGLDFERFKAAQFLEQASLGFTSQHIQDVMDMGIADWIESQSNLPVSSVLTEMNSIWEIIKDSLTANGMDIPRRPNANVFQYAWWQVNMINADLLRHRVASALSEIWVISRNSDLSGYGDGLAAYYDLLLKNALGNYRTLMYDITVNPSMGYYLSHANNPKSDTTIGRFPDENYARELMQLFTIGLVQLNPDGTAQMSGGEEVPTYDNDDIIEYSKIFTGLSYGALLPGSTATLKFGVSKGNVDMTVPMIMYDMDDPSTNRTDEDQHENGPKTLLGGEIVPDGQSGIQDINQALDNLFNHPNVGPFVSYRLIQRLVKSNPSPAYVGRVASVFDNNGSGVRGDLKAVVTAILLDNEARTCSSFDVHDNAQLKEPLLRYTQFARAVEKDAPSGFLWNHGNEFLDNAGQAILSAPSVFNFFLPIDAPNGPIENTGLVAPEFRLHDAKFSVGYINQVYNWTRNGRLFVVSGRDRSTNTTWDISNLEPIAEDVEHYINWMDTNITHGQMKTSTRAIIRDALNQIPPSRNNYLSDRVRTGMYLALISSDYTVNR